MQFSVISQVCIMLQNSVSLPRPRLLAFAVAAATAAIAASSVAQAQAPVKVEKVIVTASPFSDQAITMALWLSVVVPRWMLARLSLSWQGKPVRCGILKTSAIGGPALILQALRP